MHVKFILIARRLAQVLCRRPLMFHLKVNMLHQASIMVKDFRCYIAFRQARYHYWLDGAIYLSLLWSAIRRNKAPSHERVISMHLAHVVASIYHLSALEDGRLDMYHLIK